MQNFVLTEQSKTWMFGNTLRLIVSFVDDAGRVQDHYIFSLIQNF